MSVRVSRSGVRRRGMPPPRPRLTRVARCRGVGGAAERPGSGMRRRAVEIRVPPRRPRTGSRRSRMAAIGRNGQEPPPGIAAARSFRSDLSGPVGPIEWITIAFPPGGLNAGVASALAHLVDSGTIHILDLLVVHKNEDGSA